MFTPVQFYRNINCIFSSQRTYRYENGSIPFRFDKKFLQVLLFLKGFVAQYKSAMTWPKVD